MFIPKNLMSVSAQLTASAATYYTSTNTKTLVTKASVCNNDTVVRTFTVYSIKSGGGAGDTNLLVKTRSIAPGESQMIPELQGEMLENGDFIQALADVTLKVSLFMSGIQLGL